jgi:SAM-dependent methyltransferase
MITPQSLQSWYETVAYNSLPHRVSHPDHLAVQAAMAGVETVPLEGCSVLELGCASGGNLLPMCEVMPKARFVGIDLSPRQIDLARADAAAAGIRNVKFIAGDLREFQTGDRFDFIMAHGVYSWVPADARDRLLRLCADLLSPTGVAMISFNTKPGWSVRGIIGDLHRLGMLPTTASPTDTAGVACATASALSAAAGGMDPAWAELLRVNATVMGDRPVDQLLHDDLEPVNHPVYLAEFVAHASSHGLRYVSTADPAESLTSLPVAALQQLRQLSSDPLTQEQYADVLLARTFRHALLCRADVQPMVVDAGAVLRRCWLASNLVWKELPGVDAIRFSTRDRRIDLRPGAAATALQRICTAWPAAVSFADLEPSFPPEPAHRQQVVNTLLTLARDGLLESWMRQPAWIAGNGQGIATPLMRLQAQRGRVVTNLRHVAIELDDAARAALLRLDGGPSPADLAAEVRVLSRNSFLACAMVHP